MLRTLDPERANAYDDFARAIAVIGEPHRMIHDGFMLNASGIKTAIANAANLDLLIRLPAGTIRHVTQVEFAIDDAPVTVSFYEDTTVSANGTLVNIRNHNRVSKANDSATLMYEGPTITGVGTLLATRYIPSAAAAGGQAAGNMVSGDDLEWILGSPTVETLYLWRLTNNSGGNIDVGFHFNGYGIDY